MTNKESNTIRNGVIATVIGGLVLAFILSNIVRDFIYQIFKSLGSFFWLFWNWLIENHQLPGWLIVFIIIFSIPTLFLILKKSLKKEQSEHAGYIEDIIFDAKWRWEWSDNQIRNLWAFCPQCDCELIYHDKTAKSVLERENETVFFCERCRRVVASLEGNRDHALGTVRREIERKIRTGEFKK